MALNNHLRTELGIWLLAIIAIGLHLATLPFPPVNMEFAFASASRYLATGSPPDLGLYFHYQANTLGIPLVAYLFHSLVPIGDILQSPRVIAIFGIVPLTYAIILLSRQFSLARLDTLLLTALILSTPLVWVYSQRGTADFLPMAIGMLGMALFVSRPFVSSTFIAILLLNLAVTLKYHAIVFVVLLTVYLLLGKGKITRHTVTSSLFLILATLLLPALYLVYTWQQFGFWITPPRFATLHQITFANVFTNFFSYATYLFLLSLPFSLVILYQGFRQGHRQLQLYSLVLTVVVIIISLLLPGAKGEMNFGPLDRFITPMMFQLLSGIGTAALLLMLYFMARRPGTPPATTQESRFVYACVAGILIFLLLLSLSRPAQRYLLLVLPLLYLLLFLQFRHKPVKILTLLTLGGFVFLNTYATAYQYVTGTAAQEMVRKLTIANLLQQTAPGAIESHQGHMFFTNNKERARYIVVPGKNSNAIMTVEVTALGMVRRAYSLVETRRRPDRPGPS